MIFDRTNIEKLSELLDVSENPSGVLLIDKEKNWTSFDVVAKLRNLLKIKKIGHAGTLDPLATGLLIICFGKYTKSIEQYQSLKKQYYSVIKIGAETLSGDAEFEEENIKDFSHLTEKDVSEAVMSFVGRINQVPPMFSAKKIKGKPLYRYARKGQVLNPKPVEVEIYKIVIEKIELPYVSFFVECSKGTYIRSLATDIGKKLGVGAYLFDLRRTKIGDYSVDNAFKINELIQLLPQKKE